LGPPFSLLISTFSLLIAWSDSPCGVDSNSHRVPFPLYRTFYYRSFHESFSLSCLELTASVSDLVSCISGASFLVLYVVTRFFTDGCFQAHRQVVFGHSLPFALSLKFETLSVDLGCFPLNVQYFSTAVGLRSILFPSLFAVCTKSVHFDMPSLVQSSTPLGFKRALLQQLS